MRVQYYGDSLNTGIYATSDSEGFRGDKRTNNSPRCLSQGIQHKTDVHKQLASTIIGVGDSLDSDLSRSLSLETENYDGKGFRERGDCSGIADPINKKACENVKKKRKRSKSRRKRSKRRKARRAARRKTKNAQSSPVDVLVKNRKNKKPDKKIAADVAKEVDNGQGKWCVGLGDGDWNKGDPDQGIFGKCGKKYPVCFGESDVGSCQLSSYADEQAENIVSEAKSQLIALQDEFAIKDGDMYLDKIEKLNMQLLIAIEAGLEEDFLNIQAELNKHLNLITKLVEDQKASASKSLSLALTATRTWYQSIGSEAERLFTNGQFYRLSTSGGG